MIWDITPLVSPRLKVWPGDTPPRREVLLDLARGDNITLSTLHTTVHLGAHADAPSHYGDGPAIHEVNLATYLGPCQVVRVSPKRKTRLGAMPGPLLAPRVLFATGTYPDPELAADDFAALAPELISELASHGVILLGVDTPSVDLFDSRDLPGHKACLRHGIAILEGLVLAEVPAGVYELIALPLRLEGFDASPVRAVLRSIG